MGSTIHEIEDSPVYYPLILTKPQWYILQQMMKSWFSPVKSKKTKKNEQN